jgi:hypothetical protein
MKTPTGIRRNPTNRCPRVVVGVPYPVHERPLDPAPLLWGGGNLGSPIARANLIKLLATKFSN